MSNFFLSDLVYIHMAVERSLLCVIKEGRMSHCV